MSNPVQQRQTILEAARTLFRPGHVVEVRVPKAAKLRTISGYFDDLEALASAVANLERANYPGVYWTLNPVNRALLSRAANKLKNYADTTTSDHAVEKRLWLLVDLDPKRPAGISSTDAEHDQALELARQIAADLVAAGWPEPILADSGNGAHLLYAIDLPNDVDSEKLLKAVLQGLGAKYDTPAVDVDRTTFNASRIAKIYGTTARKGDSTEERPHRLSRILSIPQALIVLDREQLEAIAAAAPAPPPRSPQLSAPPRPYPSQAQNSLQFDLRRWLDDHSIHYRAPVPHEGNGLKYVLEHCPFNAEHKAPDAAVFERSDGYGFKCFHNSCSEYGWKEFRDHFEPVRPRRSAFGSSAPPPPPHPADSEPQQVEEEKEEEPAELPPSPDDIEAAVDAAIAAGALVAALRLIPDIAKLRLQFQIVIKAKLKQKFGKDFDVRDFDRALKDAASDSAEESDEPGQNSSGKPPSGGGDGDASAASNGDGDNNRLGPDLCHYPLTDGGNGERIAVLYGADIRYCVQMKKWLVWDGRRWAIDEMNVMRQKGKEMARLLYLQAARVADNGLRVALERHARASESYAAISNALGQAATEAGVVITAAELDQQPMLLNCQNGVVDLRTGNLLPHKRELLITKLCPVRYEPNAKCPKFMNFIHWAMGAVEDHEVPERTTRLISFLQRAFGYSLTSHVSEKSVFIFYGEKGNNGKTTLLTLFRRILGRDYSGELLIDTVMSTKTQESVALADMADLRGVRLVQTSEVEKEHKLNDRKIKYLTAGMGTIKSKRLYENPIEFEATHKLFMDCNHRPTVRGVDDAIWRRLKLVPFEVTIPDEEIDLQLPAKLYSEAPGVLAWAVRGCMQWQQEGLGSPPEVAQANLEWREHDDPLKEFLDDCCTPGDELFVIGTDLSKAYEFWCKQNRERFPIGREAFKERLHSKGFRENRSRRIDGKQQRTWEGLELNPDVLSAIRRGSSTAMWRDDDET